MLEETGRCHSEMPTSQELWVGGEWLVSTDRQTKRAKEHERERRKKKKRHRATVPMATEVEVQSLEGLASTLLRMGSWCGVCCRSSLEQLSARQIDGKGSSPN